MPKIQPCSSQKTSIAKSIIIGFDQLTVRIYCQRMMLSGKDQRSISRNRGVYSLLRKKSQRGRRSDPSSVVHSRGVEGCVHHKRSLESVIPVLAFAAFAIAS